MPRRNPPPTRPARNRIILYTAIMLAVVASWPLALAHLAAPPAPADSGIEAQAEFVRQIPLPVNDVVYNPADHLLYVSVPSSAGGAGNTVAPVNPATGEIGTPVFVGSEPSKLAMADDGHTLYVTMDGSYTIRRFDTATRTPGAEFAVGQDSFHGVYSANDLAVAPGNPNVVAVVRYYLGTSPPEAGVAIFDNGVQRPKTGVGHISGSDYVAYSASESKLYGGGSYDGLRTMTIDATGVASTTISAQSAGTRIKFANGRIYGSGGQVFNPDTNTLLGTFAGVSTFAFTVDTAAERAYYVSRDFSSGSVTLRAFNINTFVTVGSVTLSGVTGDPLTLVRWGTNGLALRTSSNQLFVVQTSLIPSGDPVPTPTATPVPTATPSPTPVATFVRQIPLATNDLIYNTQNQLIYASVPSA
ncbi:MAG TPA: hypothetical protein VJT82_09340, partial [Pyrinomonadaceae bacterium]|nr:hypothetical protein [Pyrinomonadaceae bacterium]